LSNNFTKSVQLIATAPPSLACSHNKVRALP
jgi:hypothetical protein